MAYRRPATDDKLLPETIKEIESGNGGLTLFERIKQDVANKNKNRKSRTLFRCLVFVMVFHTSTELYACMHYIIPFVFQDYSPWTHYYMNVLVWFVVINMVANWLCVMLYNPAYTKTRDNPFLRVDNQHAPDQFIARIENAASLNGVNGHCVYDSNYLTMEESIPWHFCEKCSMHVPFRTHHCDVCKTCILKRDHHCYMVDTCIGFKNQRYWIILTFYIALNCILCGCFTFKYVRTLVWPTFSSWTDLVFPITIWRSLFGDIPALSCILVLQLYVEFVYGVLSFVYFNTQMVMTAEGKTLYEVTKKVQIRNTQSINRNMKSVFGDCWALNFLFPMTLVFRQRDDGIHWDGLKVGNNSKERKNQRTAISDSTRIARGQFGTN